MEKYFITGLHGKQAIMGNVYSIDLSNGEKVQVGAENHLGETIITDIKSGFYICSTIDGECQALELARNKLETLVVGKGLTMEEKRKQALDRLKRMGVEVKE